MKITIQKFNIIIDDPFPLKDKTEYNDTLSIYDLGIVFSVIDRRYHFGRPLIVITNFPIKQLKEETTMEKKQIYDRILKMCIPLYIGGDSRRRNIANHKMQKIK